MFYRCDSRHGKKTAYPGAQRFFLFSVAAALSLAAVRPAQSQVTENILHTFNAYADGENPYSSLIQGKDGAYYGTTLVGGTNRDGTVFKISPAGRLTTLHSFTDPDGKQPFGNLVQGGGGALYGTTRYGGTYSWGVLFKIN